MNQPYAAFDGRTTGEPGQPDFFVVGHFVPKLAFLLFAVAMTAFGVWQLADPVYRLVAGERAMARVSRIVQQEPGSPDRSLRVRREIPEQGFDTYFRHHVEVTLPDGATRELRMAIDSRRKPYALVNDRFTVAYLPHDGLAYGVYHHRTWGFGAAFLLMGATFLPLAWFLLRAVGTRITIDPESAEALEDERRALAGLPPAEARSARESDPA